MENKGTIKDLKIRSTVLNVLQKSCILVGTGFIGGAIALGATGQSNVECALVGFAALTTGIQLLSDADNAKRKLEIYENSHQSSILGQQKYYASEDIDIEVDDERDFSIIETKPLLTREELKDLEPLDLSAIEVKPITKKHKKGSI